MHGRQKAFWLKGLRIEHHADLNNRWLGLPAATAPPQAAFFAANPASMAPARQNHGLEIVASLLPILAARGLNNSLRQVLPP
jgi:hypothetical protein